MFIKETIQQLLAEVVELKRRCAASEEKLENLASKLASTKQELADILEERRMKRQKNKIEKSLRKLRTKIFGSNVTVRIIDKPRNGNLNIINNTISGTATAEIKFAAKDRSCENPTMCRAHVHEASQAQETEHKPMKTVDQQANAKDLAVTKIKRSESRGNYETSLRNHKALHSLDRKYEIAYAIDTDDNMIVPDALRIIRHLRANECEICSKTFLSDSGLRRHQLVFHTNTRNIAKYKCPWCPKGFPHRQQLMDHKNYHAKLRKGKRFACRFCGKLYQENRELVVHERIHTGVRPFVCSVCQKSFTKRSYLTNHVKIHIRSFSCSNCSKQFHRVESLRLHRTRYLGACPRLT